MLFIVLSGNFREIIQSSPLGVVVVLAAYAAPVVGYFAG